MALSFPKDAQEGDFFIPVSDRKYRFTNGAWRIHINNQPNAEFALNWSSIQNPPNYVLTLNGNPPDANGNVAISTLGNSTNIAQGSNSAISLNGSIVVTHESEPLNKRLISVFENVITGAVLSPILTANDSRVIYSPNINVDALQPWNAFRKFRINAYSDIFLISGDPPGNYVGWDFIESVKIQAVSFGTKDAGYGPNSFVVQGSYDGLEWFDISYISTSWPSAAPQLFSFNNNISYSKYRILIMSHSSFGSVYMLGLTFYGPAVGGTSIDDSDYSVIATETTTTITKLTTGTASWTANVILP